MAFLCKKLLIVVLVSTTCAAQLILDVQDDEPFPERGHPIRLTCSDHTDIIISENPTDGKIVWMKDGQELAKWPVSLDAPNIQAQCQYAVSGTQYDDSSLFFAYLDINSMDATCNGVYSCRLEESEENIIRMSNEERLTVKQRPSSEYPECSVHSIADEKALICTSERGAPPVSLQWWKDGQQLEQSGSIMEDFVRARWSVAGDDEHSLGKFECCLTYEGVPSGCCILDRPTVTIHSNRPTTNLNIGQDIVFTCIVSGSPPATVSWDKTDIHAPTQEEEYELYVNNITFRDNGSQVLCKAHNAMGSNQASSLITVKPVELTIELVQTKTPESLSGLAQFKCRTIPARSIHYIWQYNGLYIDPSNTTDRFIMEKENILSVLQVSGADIGASVTCRIMVSYQLTAVVSLNASFPLTIPTEPEKTPDNDFLGLGLGTLLGYIIGGLMCLVLIGICCWVSLKAKSLMCDKNETMTDQKDETTAKSQNNQLELENLVVDFRNHLQLPTLPPQVTKQLLVEQEETYQDLEDVSRQRQINEYQRLISNDWAPQPPHS